MLAFISQGLGLGIGAGAIPGPLYNYIINETILYGFRRSFVISLVPLMTDAPIILLMLVVLEQLPDIAVRGLQVVGGGFIFYLAWIAWQQSHAAVILRAEAGVGHVAVWRALLVNWLNPAPYIFWGTVTGPILSDALDESPLYALAFLVAFYLPLCGMLAIVGAIFDRVRTLNEDYLRWVIRFSAVLLVAFGFILIVQGISA